MSKSPRIKIRELNRLNLEKIGYGYVKTKIGEMSQFSSVAIVNSGLSGYLFRVRLNPPNKPQSTSELREPAAKYVSGYQRCNPPSQPMFYSASRRITAILECDPDVGDVIYLGQWRIDKRFAINSVLRPELLGSDVEFSNADQQLINYYDTVFTRPIHQKYSSQYKLTSAITEKMTSGFPPGNADGYEISALGHVALSYPSVVDIENGYNMVLYPEMVDECLNLAHVMEARVISRSGDEVGIKVTDNSNVIEHGVISWTGNPEAVPFEKNGNKTIYVTDGGSWRLGVREEKISVAELDT